LEKVITVIWSDAAKEALKAVFNYHVDYGESSAKKLITEIIDTADEIVFSQQYQVDEINPTYRRIIVRDYKVLYTENNNVVQIMGIVNTKQSPEKLKSK
jgi:plasmid stabilization system protein ParE